MKDHNGSGHWPLGSIGSGDCEIKSWNCASFSFGGEYAITEDKKNIIVSFTMSFPLVGSNKINTMFNQSVLDCYQTMSDARNKQCVCQNYKASATLHKQGSKYAWVFRLSENSTQSS